MSNPSIEYHFSDDLPVAARREDIAAAIRSEQVVIVAGETGSGKTTQLPKICLQLGRGQNGMIGHTQPRRIAARTVAQRIAEELGQPIGETVGFQVRFQDVSADATQVKLMTDGILLAEIQRDPLLRRYDTLIIDEAHERSLNIDFLLGYLKQLLPKRPDLKLIITSATIDVDSFSRHFDDAPILEVSGRTYPVSVHYQEPDPGADGNEEIVAAIGDIIGRRWGEPGDVLVFLSGEREIRELANHLRKSALDNVEVLPLYARLSAAEQAKVFQQRRGRGIRVVLATNVAETSLTVPGIRYVIDPGFARISRYSYRTKMQRLPVEAISQASANQRKGRCGRVAEGVCIRLYSEEDFQQRPEFTEPEIKRTNLASVILQMLRLGLGDVEAFPFLDPPDSRQVRDGLALLAELSAVTATGELTAMGRRMADFPLDPRFARMLLAAAEVGCLRELLLITSGLSVQDPRERPVDKQQAADEKHRRFWDQRSDFLAWVNLWNYCEEQRQALSRNRWRKQAQKEFLSYRRLLEWRDIHVQLVMTCRQLGLEINRTAADYETVHRALMSGLLGNLAQQDEGHRYRGARNSSLQIFPGSSQFKSRPKWIVSAEIVETSKVYARCVAFIDPAWALEINPSLLRHHYFEPRWQARTGRVMAYDRITLYGLILRDRQRVHYGPLNKAESREILIREGLVVGRVRQPPAFLRHNLREVEKLEELESRFRRRDIVVDEQAQVDFYLERLPANITTINRLKAWLKKDKTADQMLRMSREQLSLRAVTEELGNQFPDTLRWQDFELPLSYHFEPGHPRDGVSVAIPLGLLNRVPRYLLEWLVPGLLREKCIHLVKALPKALRKQLVPVPDFVDRALANMEPSDRPLTLMLSETLQQVAGVKVAATDWPTASMEAYYRINIQILDADGELLAEGRDLDQLVKTFRDTGKELKEETTGPLLKNLKRWPEEDIPSVWRMRQAGHEIESYPALVVSGDSVALELLDYPMEAEIAHRWGVIWLLRAHCADQVRYIRKQYLKGNQFSLALAGSSLERDPLIEDMVDACFKESMLGSSDDPRTLVQFKEALQIGKPHLIEKANDYEQVLASCLATSAEIVTLLAGLRSPATEDALRDIEGQMDQLYQPGFMRDTPFDWLRHYPRYFKAMLNRARRLKGQLGKDESNRAMLSELEQPLRALIVDRPGILQLSQEASHFRWMLEEFRVSLFAQSLGTTVPVSAKRLTEQWQKVEEWLLEHPV